MSLMLLCEAMAWSAAGAAWAEARERRDEGSVCGAGTSTGFEGSSRGMGRAEDCDCEWEWPCCCDGGGVLLLELEAGEALARPAEMGMAWRGRGPPADDP